MLNPWDALPKEQKGDEDIRILYAAVGHALSSWEMLEGHLGRIFGYICESTSEVPARAYGVVASFNGRLDMLEEAFRCSRLRKAEQFEGLTSLFRRARKFGPRRNEIAHGVAMSYTWNEEFQGHFLSPSSYNSRKVLPQEEWIQSFAKAQEDDPDKQPAFGKYAYNSGQINFYAEQFRGLSDEAARYSSGLFQRLLFRDRI